ncbi:hypothetical protein M9H77_33509 [Catharanthus roseus]|uniref:Uncharacterized protein n=1 Tax=Catharanthus roseus TaxID=4058 RepID=A0ACB9ZK97_CATRO|nr:hypothetical protein M9H77_33509 [Catharanthus roseus]
MAAVAASQKVVEPSISPSESMDRNRSARVSDAASSDLSFVETPDRPSFLDRSPSKQSDDQNQLYLKSEEYRQLFRLPPDEVLIQDFNCALQENFLLQGHMYLFERYICFYSNLFGFETKKVIPFHEITSVKRAKAAAIFPTAIEIICGGRKFFFTSFLSRDEAFKIINDGWFQHSGVKLVADQQDSNVALIVQETGVSIVDKTESSRQLVDESQAIERDVDCSEDDLKLPVDRQQEILSISTESKDNVEADVEISQTVECSPSGNSMVWGTEDSDAPGVPECYTKVAESKFPVKVDEFFHIFFSDDAAGFQDSFHRKCGDKDFRCSKWRTHEKFGYTRDVSFQHPIKLYLGAKFGSCNEVQKYRVYRNSHLVIETSQEITDVPYGDYFRVEGLWDVEQDGESQRGCVLRVYVNVNFSKKTMFRGKIVQSTVDECRDAYASWIDLAHEVLKQKIIEIQESCDQASNLILNNRICLEKQESSVEHPEKTNEPTDLNIPQTSRTAVDKNQDVVESLRGSYNCATSMAATLRDWMTSFSSSLKGQSHTTLLLVIGIAAILLLMQMSILVLLSRPQQIQLIPQPDYIASLNRGLSEREVENALIDKQIKNLKDEMHLFETFLDKMQQEHALLKVKLKDLELLRQQQQQQR